ncbi:bifunctional PTS fructose transporter subunit IIA/HPr protein [Vibrio tarriae]|uniref:fused PTS fructose transporter subunit IIA/HPr protein n=1 Tax=Vibrio tarriae TaxID=2014742 RepID=UPI000DE3AD4F|nr:fused PTS fructose transporter subunit IIA/HPr protein [Vibrio tarriae]QEO46807.1 fused PTS fructose transporter subunit IIA/HPr protein [Vibrio cholerae]RBM25953.1 bifunctional PTS fructose transporter subunit IIA/HPr protein [Vibrio tarriae]RBM34357.1 bifunctional PTS fructose transporter subunit IIA/HPr protein [Vibrio tarriae]RBM39655.1 bifunctional PTS fructose transporter subunit IIA/HPr protein [Vibrio tarriae]RBM66914.1 bifunctional PTS fructose transporter subunit IIA/HPr protein [
MLELTTQDIQLQQHFANKQAAIQGLAHALTAKGLVAEGYAQGMINREAQHSTYLGNGIAIPHGTTDTRELVKQTGVTAMHFPQGLDWGDGNLVYVAIGIAAKSDEHLGILKQLTKVLSADGVEQALQQAKTAQQIIAIIKGEAQLTADFDASLIQLQFPASDMVQMSAVVGGLLKNTGCAENEFVADLVTKAPTHLGRGLWLVASDRAVKRTGMSIVTTANHCEYEQQPVKALIAFSVCNDAHQPLLNTITRYVFEQKQDQLLQADVQQLLNLFSGNAEQTIAQQTIAGETIAAETGTEPDVSCAHTATFRIKNSHGLHARPGAMLVAEAKKFESNIRVSNLDGDGQVVNAKSLMKVIALGVKHNHQLQFTAEGPDAEAALQALGAAINAGLGEG